MTRKVDSPCSKNIKLILGQNIKYLRQTYKITQTQLAKLLNSQQAALSRIESGLQNLTPEQLYTVASFFKVNIEHLVTKKMGP